MSPPSPVIITYTARIPCTANIGGNWSPVGYLALFKEFKGPTDFVTLFYQGGFEATEPSLFCGGE